MALVKRVMPTLVARQVRPSPSRPLARAVPQWQLIRHSSTQPPLQEKKASWGTWTKEKLKEGKEMTVQMMLGGKLMLTNTRDVVKLRRKDPKTRDDYVFIQQVKKDWVAVIPFTVLVILPFSAVLIALAIKTAPQMIPSPCLTPAHKREIAKHLNERREKVAAQLKEMANALLAQPVPTKDASTAQVYQRRFKQFLQEPSSQHLALALPFLDGHRFTLASAPSQLAAFCDYAGLGLWLPRSFLNMSLFKNLTLARLVRRTNEILVDDEHLRRDPPGSIAAMDHENLCRTLLARGYRINVATQTDDALRSLLRQHLTMTQQWSAPDASRYVAPLWLYSSLAKTAI